MVLMRALQSISIALLCLITAAAQDERRGIVAQESLVSARIKRWAALGDSYAAGLGAGLKLPQWSNHYCSRYNQSYPFVLHKHPLFNASTFDYFACSGSSSVEVLTSQLPKLSKKHKYDVITLSIGGNDVNFAAFLDACIFQWSGGTNATCEAQLKETAFRIKSVLAPRVHALLTALYPHLSLTGKIYQTGYARFFDPYTEACDNVTWSFWYSGYGPWEKQYLTRERRVRMNELVNLTNSVLRSTAEMFYPHVEFVEVAEKFEEERGRFCERGVNEPDPSREGLLFYEWNTVDGLPPINITSQPALRDHSVLPTAPCGSFERDVIDRVQRGRQHAPNGITVPQALKSITKSDTRPKDDAHEDSSSDIIPDGFMRVFHPRPGGHSIIAHKLAKIIAKDLNEPWMSARDLDIDTDERMEL